MDYSYIHAFLQVVTYRNISKAASSMYISQSNLSAKISRMEEELGFQVFIRSRGKHTIELTPKGQQFLIYAQQIDYSLRRIKSLKSEDERTFLSIGANDSIHQFTLNDFYQKFIVDHPKICLWLHTYHSSDIYTNIMNNRFDLGIVSNPREISGIKTIPLFDEPLFIIARRDSPYFNGITPDQLPGKEEIFMAYGDRYIQWHEQYWPDRQYFIRLSDASDLDSFMITKEKWALIGASKALQYMKTDKYSIYRLSIEPPLMSFYLVEKENKYQAYASEIYKEELFQFLRNNVNVISKV